MWLNNLYIQGKISKSELIKRRKTLFREIREKQFKAFDIWERAVLRGREQDDHQIIEWYNAMLDFPEQINEDTINEDFPTIPEALKKYL